MTSSIATMLMHIGLFVTIPVAFLLLVILLAVYYARWSHYVAGECYDPAQRKEARRERRAR